MGGMGKKLKILLLTAAVLALGSGTALAGWIFTDLSTIGDIVGDIDSYAMGINNNGDIVGKARFAGDEYSHAVLWSDGVAYDLGTLGEESSAGAINDDGVIAGSYWILGGLGGRHAALFSADAAPVDIYPAGLFPYPEGANDSMVAEINNSGQMVGYAMADTLPQVPVFWEDASTYRVLDAGPNDMGYTLGLNNLGQVVGAIEIARTEPTTGYIGYRPSAAFWDVDGTLTDLGIFDGWTSNAYDINDLGQVLVGVIDSTLENRWALVWQDGEVVERLADLGGSITIAESINNNGQIVGLSYTAEGVAHAVLWQDGEIIDLNDLISDTDLVLSCANEINEKGQIVGYGTKDDGTTNGLQFAFLLTPDLTPTPIPASLLLFGSGLAGLGVFRRRFRQG